MKSSQISKGWERPKKAIRETIKKYFDINELDRSIVLDRTLWLDCWCEWISDTY